jgi:hypothetical protein
MPAVSWILPPTGSLWGAVRGREIAFEICERVAEAQERTFSRTGDVDLEASTGR